MERYSKNLINYVWFLEVERNGNECTILRHGRLHWRDAKGIEAKGTYSIIEGKGRVAEQVSVTFTGHYEDVMRVTNPRHVFDYPEFEKD